MTRASQCFRHAAPQGSLGGPGLSSPAPTGPQERTAMQWVVRSATSPGKSHWGRHTCWTGGVMPTHAQEGPTAGSLDPAKWGQGAFVSCFFRFHSTFLNISKSIFVQCRTLGKQTMEGKKLPIIAQHRGKPHQMWGRLSSLLLLPSYLSSLTVPKTGSFCACMHTHVQHVHTHEHTQTRTHKHTCTHMCTHACTRPHMSVHTRMSMHACALMYVHVRMHV